MSYKNTHKSISREEMLRNVMESYSLHSRAIEKGRIVHITKNGFKRDAIGMELDSTRVKMLDPNEYISEDCNFNLLPKRLKEFGKDFLQDIQNLHDKDIYWESWGLSHTGLIYCRSLIAKYNLKMRPKNIIIESKKKVKIW